jgi:Tetratricopeptide repeat
MFFVQLVVGFIVGIISIFYVSQILIPIFYCVPKSIYLSLKGQLRPSAIFFWFRVPLIWIAIPFLVGFFFPSIVDTSFFKFIDNPVSAVVTNIMVAGLILSSVFTSKGRADAKADFWNSTNKYRTIPLTDLENLGALQYFGDARKMYQSNDFKGAIAKYDMAIAVFTLNAPLENAADIDVNALLKDAYYNRGCAKDELKDYEGAINDYTKAIEFGSNHSEEYLNRGLAKYELHLFQEAIKDYDKAIEIDPEKGTAYFGRGNAKYQIGDKENACLDWSKAAKLGLFLADEMITKYCK